MARGMKVCRICGAEYEGCHTQRPNLNNEFRWQEVACCPEHGAEYLKQILASRGANRQESEEVSAPAVEETGTKKRRSRKKAAPED